MKKNKLLCIMLSVMLVLLSCAACGSAATDPTEPAGMYCFENYEDSEVFDIVKVDLSGELAAKCVSYRFTYLSDGYRIKAYISIPTASLGTQKPTKCVLFNRGGNRNKGSLTDDMTANLCAVCERVVVASEYRGGGGSQGTDQFGGDDLHDVIKLIDLCESRFTFVDMDDFCVAGTSRGGMMAYMAARQDERIKRVIAVSAVSDLAAMYESREDMQDILQELIGSTPQEAPDEYRKRSAICWYDEIKVPVLMIHSKLDKQVDYQQAQALYEKLKGVTDCTFVTHDDDTHGTLHADDGTAIRSFLGQ